jgi:hypothetical protein
VIQLVDYSVDCEHLNTRYDEAEKIDLNIKTMFCDLSNPFSKFKRINSNFPYKDSRLPLKFFNAIWCRGHPIASRIIPHVATSHSLVTIPEAQITDESTPSVGMDDRMIGVRFPAGAGNFSLRHHVQTGSGAHPAFYSVGTGDSLPGGKAAGA